MIFKSVRQPTSVHPSRISFPEPHQTPELHQSRSRSRKVQFLNAPPALRPMYSPAVSPRRTESFAQILPLEDTVR